MSYELTIADLADLVRGVALLGTGGGGDPTIGYELVAHALESGKTITIVSPDELDDDDLVIPTALIGAPTVLMEKLPRGTEPIAALQELERVIGRKATMTMPIECGGINSTIPLYVGAMLGIPVVDADGMGRAFPELQMETFAIYGISGSPLAIADEFGNCAVVNTGPDNKKMENWTRSIAVRMGGVGYIAEYAMSGADVKMTAIPGTLSIALSLGRALREARENHRNPAEALSEALAGTIYRTGDVVFTGKIVDVERQTVGGFNRGHARIEDFEGRHECVIEFQNEFLIAKVDGEVRVIVPDLVTVLHIDTGEPITAETLRYGQRVQVFAIGTPPIMRTPEALATFGPSAFGLDHRFVPFDQLTP